jgi:hypothetical protein
VIRLAALALLAAIGVATAPLVVYAVTLALFGWAHVVIELRYVRDRFAARADPRLAATWIVLLGLLVLARAADIAGADLGPGGRTKIELALLVALLAVTAMAARGAARLAAVGATAALGLLFLGVHPAAAIAVLAFLHNLTPLGFLAERLRGEPRRRSVSLVPVASLVLVAFLVVPALLLGGVFERLLAAAGRSPIDGAFLGIGATSSHFGAYLPESWQGEAWAPRLFAAAVYLQCAHYFVVIHVLPRLGAAVAAQAAPDAPAPARRWSRTAVAVCAAIGVALAAGFARSFGEARALYGIAAAVHAFVEWPLFLALIVGVVGKRAPAAAGAFGTARAVP